MKWNRETYEYDYTMCELIKYAFVLAVIIFVIALIWEYIHLVRVYNRSTPEHIHAKLIDTNYKESTLESHVSPGIVHVDGKTGLTAHHYTTGHAEKFTTIWETKEYGRLLSTDKKIWQYAKPESILLVKQWFREPYIDGIER